VYLQIGKHEKIYSKNFFVANQLSLGYQIVKPYLWLSELFHSQVDKKKTVQFRKKKKHRKLWVLKSKSVCVSKDIAGIATIQKAVEC
jgi:hypothetical protein